MWILWSRCEASTWKIKRSEKKTITCEKKNTCERVRGFYKAPTCFFWVREPSRCWSMLSRWDQAFYWTMCSICGRFSFIYQEVEESKNLSQAVAWIMCRCSAFRLAIVCPQYTPHVATIMNHWPRQEAPTTEKPDPCQAAPRRYAHNVCTYSHP